MSQRVTSRTGVAVVSGAPESRPGKREFPEQLFVLAGLTTLVLALAAWAHAVGPQDPAHSSFPVFTLEAPATR